MKNIVAFTMNPAIDKSSGVDHVIAERKLYCTPPRFEPGGGGVNVARAIKKLGGEAMLFYAAGGLTGERLQQLLDQEELNHRIFPIEGWTRESLAILEETTGQQYRFGMPGPQLRPEEWQGCLDTLATMTPPPDFLVASGSLPPGVPENFYAQVARLGRDRGAKVIIDAGGQALAQALQEGVYLIKPNIREFRELTGQELQEEAEIRAAAQALVRRGNCQVLVISLGAAGALLVAEDIVEHIRPPTVPTISKVGAGDSMVAGIVLSLARGRGLRDAVFFGIATGAAAVMTPGSELCRREDAERLYHNMVTEHGK